VSVSENRVRYGRVNAGAHGIRVPAMTKVMDIPIAKSDGRLPSSFLRKQESISPLSRG
jgi:hypothetical protein